MYIGAAVLALSAAGCRGRYLWNGDKAVGKAAEYYARAEVVDVPPRQVSPEELMTPEQKRVVDERLKQIEQTMKLREAERMPVLRGYRWQLEIKEPLPTEGWIRRKLEENDQLEQDEDMPRYRF
jgi:hypothetical protein